MARLPIPGSDKGTWGEVLNEYLSVEHNADGTLRTDGALADKQDLLVSGTNLKTIHSNSLLGSGDITLTNIPESSVTNLVTDLAAKQATLVSGANIKTVNSTSILGGGDIVTGNVVGPASGTDNAIARFDTTTGKLIQNSIATIDDTGNITTPGIAVSGGVVALAPVASGTSGNYIEVLPSSTSPTLRAAGSGTNIDVVVKGKGTGKVRVQPITDSTDAFDVANATGTTTVLSVDTTNQRASIGTNSVPRARLDLGASTASAASISMLQGVQPTAPYQGDIWLERNRGLMMAPSSFSNAAVQALPGILYVGNGNVIQNTTTETTLLTNGAGNGTKQYKMALTTNQFVNYYRIIRIDLQGTFSTTSTPGNLTLRLKLNDGTTTSIFTTVITTLPPSVTDRNFSIHCLLNNVSNEGLDDTSYSGTIAGEVSFALTAATRGSMDFGNTASFITASSDITIDITAQWATANSSNRIQCRAVVIESLN